MKKTALRISVLLPVLLLVALFKPEDAHAGAAINLSPATGAFNQLITVDVVVNNTGTAAAGYDLDLLFTGPVTYTNYTAGSLGCGTLLVSLSSAGRVSILCLGAADYLPNTGTIAKLTFTATGTGAVAMTMQNMDDSVAVDSLTGGNYTVTSTSTGGGGTLPQTSFFEDYAVAVGIVLLLIGGGTYAVFRHYDRFNKEDALQDTAAMSDKVRDS